MDYATFDAKNRDLRDLNLKVVDLMGESAKFAKEASEWIGSVKASINASIGADGKPTHSNDAKRDAALVLCQSSSQVWQSIDEKMSNINRDLAIARAEIEYAKNDIRWLISANND